MIGKNQFALYFFALDKGECLHSAVAFENFVLLWLQNVVDV